MALVQPYLQQSHFSRESKTSSSKIKSVFNFADNFQNKNQATCLKGEVTSIYC